MKRSRAESPREMEKPRKEGVFLSIAHATPERLRTLKGPELSTESVEYLDRLQRVEDISSQQGLNHRFVGGVVADFFKDPRFALLVDPDTKTMYVGGDYKPPKTKRDDGSITDIDMMSFCSDQQTYDKATGTLSSASVEGKKITSIEPTRYFKVTHLPDHPWTRRGQDFFLPQAEQDWPLRQTDLIHSMTTTTDVFVTPDMQHHLYLGFYNKRTNLFTPTSDKSFEPWTLVINGSVKGENSQENRQWKITTLSPEALLLRYLMRNPGGLKKKDIRTNEYLLPDQQGKMHTVSLSKVGILAEIARVVREDIYENNPDYVDPYKSWHSFINQLLHHPDFSTKMKSLILAAYWGEVKIGKRRFSIGERLSHDNPDKGDRFAGGVVSKSA